MHATMKGTGLLFAALVWLALGCDRELLDERTSRVKLGKAPSTSGDPIVNSADPASATQDTTLDVKVLGSGFDRGSRADWAVDGAISPKVRTNSTRYVNSSQLVANITISADAPVTSYDVVVTTSRGKKGIGTEIFVVASKGNPALRQSYVLDFSGDIVATGVPATAFGGSLWPSMEITGGGDVRLAPVLIDDMPFNQVNPVECTYTETDPARRNSWGKNSAGDVDPDSIWSAAGLSIGPTNILSGGTNPGGRQSAEARIDIVQPPGDRKGLAAGTPTLTLLVRDASAAVAGDTLILTKAQSMVAAGNSRTPNPDPHTDPCVTVTIVARPGP